MAAKKTKKKTAPAPKAKPPKAKKAPTVELAPAGAPLRLSKLSLPELKAKYVEVVQRETDSDNRAYLLWKIREAQAGRVRVGPPLKRAGSGPQQVLSLRIDVDAVPLLDAAWAKHGMKSRMDLVRRALRRELEALGEDEVAARFAPEPA
jgi:hypothetical protein